MPPAEYTARRGRRRGRARPSEERDDGEMLFGVNPVLEQLRREPDRVRRLLVARGAERAVARVIDLARGAGIDVRQEERRELDRRARGDAHQGVAAEVEPFRYADLHELLARRPSCLLAADQVSDPRNVGAMARSAEAFGVGGLLLPRDRTAGITATAAKASAGATALLPVARVTNLVRALTDLKGAGYWVVGLDAGGDQDLASFVFPDFCVIVAGSEGKGLRPLTRATCDHLVSIPMAGRVGSLNVSVAAGVACFERLRQRHRIDSPPGR